MGVHPGWPPAVAVLVEAGAVDAAPAAAAAAAVVMALADVAASLVVAVGAVLLS